MSVSYVRPHHSCLFLSEDGEEAMHQDTDSDVAEQRDGGKVKVKWTQEEVFVYFYFFNIYNVNQTASFKH